ncbi:ABC transporter substrate-binding protein [Saccharospirillum alexandrii]|uniref:ABC transporter substrate-binding protein n=1 Tax=Saccharospirillum alexandrii TaxID=2448477 RepID=UPI000FD82D41|nr:ABC transporter substrate-binding protein [Saccharospirillum alexandrii]
MKKKWLITAAITLSSALPAFATACPENTTAVNHELGTTCVPGQVSAVVALEFSYMDATLNLGVKPVAVSRDALPLPILEVHMAGIPSVGTRAQPDLEAIAAANPDLILADLTRHTDLYPHLSAIAPTLVFNSLRGSYEDILNQYQQIADLLGERPLADTQLTEHQRRYQNVRASNQNQGQSIVIAVSHPGGFTAHGGTSFMGSILGDFGFDNAVVPATNAISANVDFEGLLALNPDILIVLEATEEVTQNPLSAWEQSPLWGSLAAVENNKVYRFDRSNWSRARGLLALNAMLDDVVNSGLLR